MDDLTVQDHRLTTALAELAVINRYLGGYSTSIRGVAAFLSRNPTSRPFRILDVGCGGGDFAEAMILWQRKSNPDLCLQIVGLDNSPATVRWARQRIDARLPPFLARRVDFQVGDAFQLPFGERAFDLVHCALFLHHFQNDQIVRLLRGLNRVAARGIVVNDLHRHPLAYWSIRAILNVLRAGEMVRHDGPLSVRRAFTRDELTRIASAAGLSRSEITWHWAFRWLLTAVE